jgi:cobalt-precorrin-5B (C1)-methyltransferase
MTRRVLRQGFSTGACAAAAAKGAAVMLNEQRHIESVTVDLPAGFSAVFPLHGQHFTTESAACFVVKDAGDDPDVTHGVEVHATVTRGRRETEDGSSVVIAGGKGIGKVTKPGLAVPIGEPAINPVPRRMIMEAMHEVFSPHPGLRTYVTISIPDGEERSRRTLNERLGIVGGLSILGTTGVVKPISHQAWTDTVDISLDVARAAGISVVVLSTGRTSERAAQNILQGKIPEGLPDEAFIMMGDHVEHSLEACGRRHFRTIILAAQFAKLVKIGCGYPQTHAGRSQLDLAQLASWGRRCGLDEGLAKRIECAGTAREALELPGDPAILAEITAEQALWHMRRRVPEAEIAILLVGYDGRRTWRFGEWPLQIKGEEMP